MEYLVREKNFKSIYFDDDTFNIGKQRMLNICAEIIKRRLDKTQWAIMARPDLMDKDILHAMKKAGLWAVKYGVESAEQSLVDKIGKDMDLRKAKQMIELTNKLGIKTHLTFTFGLPGETRNTIKKSINLSKKLNPFSVQFSIATPFPGTKYYNVLNEKGAIVSQDFSSYDGNFKSVIEFKNLSSRDLAIAKVKADRVWRDYLRKRRGLVGNLQRFTQNIRVKGVGYSLVKVSNYLRYLMFNRNEYLKVVNPDCEKTPVTSYSLVGLCRKYLMGVKKNIRFSRGKRKNEKDFKVRDLKILIIQSSPWDVTTVPLGVNYLVSYLRQYRQNNVTVFDLNIELYNYHKHEASLEYLWNQKSYDCWADRRLFKKTWKDIKKITVLKIKNILKNSNFKYIGLSVSFPGIQFTSKVIKIIKKQSPGVKIIVGGWGCVNEQMRSMFPRKLVDVFVVNEGEETLVEVIKYLEGERESNDIKGAIFSHNQNCRYVPRNPIMNIDTIPWPRYNKQYLKLYKTPTIPLLSSRGCISRCSFCNDWSLSAPYRYRSAKNIFTEIKYHFQNNGINNFSFKDLLCNGNIGELNHLCDLLIKAGLQCNWDSQAIPRKEMNYELLKKLKKAGCGTLIYGIESFSNNVLRNMRKMITAEIAEKVLEDTSKAGINAIINIIVGFPGESEEDFMETCNKVEKNKDYITQIGAVSVCLVNNDSDLDINPKKYGIILPADPRVRAKEWQTNDYKNTYQVRKRRAEKVLELISNIGLEYETKTI